jgi:hypothetical protein
MAKRKQQDTEFFRRVLRELFEEYKSKLRLNKNWSIKIQVEPTKDEYGRVEYSFDKREFTININHEMNETIHSLKDTIIHEFWHMLLSPMREKFENTLDKFEAGKPVNIKVLRKQIQNMDERMVRKFTRIIMDLERENRGKN